MIRIATAAVATLIAVGVTPSFAATNVDAPFTVAQGLDVHIGGGGPEVRDHRVIREHRIRERERDCRTVVVRRRTPDGMVTRRTRTCD
jgi:hypothetical protein